MWKPFGGQDDSSLRLTGPVTLPIADRKALDAMLGKLRAANAH